MTVSDALKVPLPTGVKSTTKGQFEFAVSVAPQVVVSLKLLVPVGVRPMLAILKLPLPVLDRVKVSGELAVAVGWFGKL